MDLGDRFAPGCADPESDPDDQCLGERRVEAALRTVGVREANRGFEDPTFGIGDIFTEGGLVEWAPLGRGITTGSGAEAS